MTILSVIIRNKDDNIAAVGGASGTITVLLLIAITTVIVCIVILLAKTKRRKMHHENVLMFENSAFEGIRMVMCRDTYSQCCTIILTNLNTSTILYMMGALDRRYNPFKVHIL